MVGGGASHCLYKVWELKEDQLGGQILLRLLERSCRKSDSKTTLEEEERNREGAVGEAPKWKRLENIKSLSGIGIWI